MGLFRKKAPRRVGRRGIITANVTWQKRTTWKAQWEVEELERAGDLVRVKVRNLSGVPADAHFDVLPLLPEWVEADTIKWLDPEPQPTVNKVPYCGGI